MTIKVGVVKFPSFSMAKYLKIFLIKALLSDLNVMFFLFWCLFISSFPSGSRAIVVSDGFCMTSTIMMFTLTFVPRGTQRTRQKHIWDQSEIQ